MELEYEKYEQVTVERFSTGVLDLLSKTRAVEQFFPYASEWIVTHVKTAKPEPPVERWMIPFWVNYHRKNYVEN